MRKALALALFSLSLSLSIAVSLPGSGCTPSRPAPGRSAIAVGGFFDDLLLYFADWIIGSDTTGSDNEPDDRTHIPIPP